MPVKERETSLLRRYSFWAPRYDRLWAKYSAATQSEAARLVARNAEHPATLLDVACGTGSFAARMLEGNPHLRITGIDLSQDMLDQARRRFNSDPRLTWLRGSAEELPVESGAFDVVTCNNAFHLMPDQKRALLEFQRALRPGGTLIVIDWDRRAPSIKFVNLNYTMFGRHPRHIMSAEELSDTVAASGFDIVHTQRFAATWFWRVAAVVGKKVWSTSTAVRDAHG